MTQSGAKPAAGSGQETIIDGIGELWDRTDLSQSQFAELLRDEADLYEEAPEQARDPNRVV